MAAVAVSPKALRVALMVAGGVTAVAGAVADYLAKNQTIDWYALISTCGVALFMYTMKYRGDFTPEEMPPWMRDPPMPPSNPTGQGGHEA